MNKRMVFYMLGRIIIVEAFLLSLPTVCSIIYKDNCLSSFLITILISVFLGAGLIALNKPTNKAIYAKEGFVIVALAWIIISALGALPFYISNAIPSYIDAFFETVSGFTTTGASILKDVEIIPKSLLFWRSFTHWIGGMGILVLVMAILPTDSGRSIHIARAEMPGPIVGKLVPKMKSTAKILYLIYIALTIIEVIFLLCGDMSLFESLIHSFGTAGTGGFSSKANSVGYYSPYIQWVITIFMLIFGVNFNLYYLLLTKKFRSVLKSEELWTYIIIVLVSVGIVTYNILPQTAQLDQAIRHSAFQVSSIITTTGYSTIDFNLWPTLSKIVLFILMFIGGCAGSTAGGIKVSRIVLLYKSIKANLKHNLHTRSVEAIKFEGRTIESKTILNIACYFALYFLCFAIILLIISLDAFDFETHITAVTACFNNVGPGFSLVGPMGNYSAYSNLSKLTLSGAMLLGRLEIFPMILLFSPSVWVKNRAKKS